MIKCKACPEEALLGLDGEWSCFTHFITPSKTWETTHYIRVPRYVNHTGNWMANIVREVELRGRRRKRW